MDYDFTYNYINDDIINYKPMSDDKTKQSMYCNPNWIFDKSLVLNVSSSNRIDIGEFRFTNEENPNFNYFCLGLFGWGGKRFVVGHHFNDKKKIMIHQKHEKFETRKKIYKPRKKRDIVASNDVHVIGNDVNIDNVFMFWVNFQLKEKKTQCSFGFGNNVLENLYYTHELDFEFTPSKIFIGGWMSTFSVSLIPSGISLISSPKIELHKSEEHFETVLTNLEKTTETAVVEETVVEETVVEKTVVEETVVEENALKNDEKTTNVNDVIFEKINELEHKINELQIKLNDEKIEKYEKDEKSKQELLDGIKLDMEYQIDEEISKKLSSLNDTYEETITQKLSRMIEKTNENIFTQISKKTSENELIAITHINDTFKRETDKIVNKILIDTSNDLTLFKNMIRDTNASRLNDAIKDVGDKLQVFVNEEIKKYVNDFETINKRELVDDISEKSRKQKEMITTQVVQDLNDFKTKVTNHMTSLISSTENDIISSVRNQFNDIMSKVIDELIMLSIAHMKKEFEKTQVSLKKDLFNTVKEQLSDHVNFLITTSKKQIDEKYISILKETDEYITTSKQNIQRSFSNDIENFSAKLKEQQTTLMSQLISLTHENYNQLLVNTNLRLMNDLDMKPTETYRIRNILDENREKFLEDIEKQSCSMNVEILESDKKSLSIINKIFDRVYLINLDSRPDRMDRMRKILTDLNIIYKRISGFDGKKEFSRIPAQFRKKPGEYGYAQSMLMILKDARENSYEKILVFDDDVIFMKGFEDKITYVTTRIIHDWKLLYLGASQHHWNDIKIDESKVYYTCNMTEGSFAIGIHNSIFDELIESINNLKLPYDSIALRRISNIYKEKCIVLYPNLVIANVEDSNIRARRNMDEYAFMFRWNQEEYDFNK